jgi:hypothetical protein
LPLNEKEKLETPPLTLQPGRVACNTRKTTTDIKNADPKVSNIFTLLATMLPIRTIHEIRQTKESKRCHNLFLTSSYLYQRCQVLHF